MKNPEGAFVAEVEADSPAAKGGVEIGDVITSANGETMKDSRDLGRKIAAITPGTATRLGVFRNGQEKTITVTLGEFPQASTVAKAEQQKVVITDISPTSRAAESDMQAGDIILDVGHRAVNTPAEVRKLVEEARPQSKKAIPLHVKQGDTINFVAVPTG